MLLRTAHKSSKFVVLAAAEVAATAGGSLAPVGENVKAEAGTVWVCGALIAGALKLPNGSSPNGSL